VFEYWLDSPRVIDEIEWIQSRLLISRSDKGANTPVFDCIKWVRQEALIRISGGNFSPGMNNNAWSRESKIMESLTSQLHALLPELRSFIYELPFLTSIYKTHKGTYRWITSANKLFFHRSDTTLITMLQLGA
jgi:hypothetical protein